MLNKIQLIFETSQRKLPIYFPNFRQTNQKYININTSRKENVTSDIKFGFVPDRVDY